MNLHEFWFGEIALTPEYYERQIRRWFWGNNPGFDEECRRSYAPFLESEFLIPENSRDYLTLILLLDQVPRNSFRKNSRAFAHDRFAQELTLAALGTKFEAELSLPERIFLYMPLEHAEDLKLQDLSVEKFRELHRLAPDSIRPWTQLGVEKAIEHRKTIAEFGYFPARMMANSDVGSGA